VQPCDDLLDAVVDGLLLRVDDDVGIVGLLEGVVDPREVLEIARFGLLVETLRVAAGTLLDGALHVDEDELPVGLDDVTGLPLGLAKRRDHPGDDRDVVAVEQLRDEGRPAVVDAPFLLGESEVRVEVLPDLVAVEVLDLVVAIPDVLFEATRQRRLARRRPAHEPEREAHASASTNGSSLSMMNSLTSGRIIFIERSSPSPSRMARRILLPRG